MYWKYFRLLLHYKYIAFFECLKRGIFIYAFTFYNYEFRPSIFIHKAKKFSDISRVTQEEIEKIKLVEYHINKQSLKYWSNDKIKIEIPNKYANRFYITLLVLGRMGGFSPRKFFEVNCDNIKKISHPKTYAKIGRICITGELL